MKRNFRLTRSTDFQRVRRCGKSYAHPLIVLVASTNGQKVTRFGIIAGYILGNAVHRNRVKRLLRAAIHAFLTEIDSGWDIVLIARKPIMEAGYYQVSAALEMLLKRAQLLRDCHDV